MIFMSGWACSSATIHFEMMADAMTFRYAYQLADGTRKQVVEPIKIEPSTCYFGGCRHWFHCPECGRRVTLLYLKKGLFRCRTCHDLTFTTCREQPVYGIVRRIQKLRASVGGDENVFSRFPPKPNPNSWGSENTCAIPIGYSFEFPFFGTTHFDYL